MVNPNTITHIPYDQTKVDDCCYVRRFLCKGDDIENFSHANFIQLLTYGHISHSHLTEIGNDLWREQVMRSHNKTPDQIDPQQLEAKRREHQRLMKEVQDLRQQTKDETARYDARVQDHRDAQKKLTSEERRYSEVNKEVLSKQREHNMLVRDIHKAHLEHDSLDLDRQDAKKKLTAEEGRYKEVNQEVLNKQREHNRLMMDIQKSEVERNEIECRRKNMVNDFESKQQARKQLIKTIAKEEARLQTLRTNIEEIESQRNQLLNQKQKLLDQQLNKQNSCPQSKQVLEEINQKLDRSSQLQGETLEQMQTESAQLRNELERMKARMEEIHKENRKQQEETRKLNAMNMNQLIEKTIELKNRMEQKMEELRENSRQEKQKLYKMLQESKIEELEEELHNERRRAPQKVAALEKELDGHRIRMEELVSAYRESDKQIQQKLDDQAKSLMRTHDRLEDRMLGGVGGHNVMAMLNDAITAYQSDKGLVLDRFLHTKICEIGEIQRECTPAEILELVINYRREFHYIRWTTNSTSARTDQDLLKEMNWFDKYLANQNEGETFETMTPDQIVLRYTEAAKADLKNEKRRKELTRTKQKKKKGELLLSASTWVSKLTRVERIFKVSGKFTSVHVDALRKQANRYASACAKHDKKNRDTSGCAHFHDKDLQHMVNSVLSYYEGDGTIPYDLLQGITIASMCAQTARRKLEILSVPLASLDMKREKISVNGEEKMFIAIRFKFVELKANGQSELGHDDVIWGFDDMPIHQNAPLLLLLLLQHRKIIRSARDVWFGKETSLKDAVATGETALDLHDDITDGKTQFTNNALSVIDDKYGHGSLYKRMNDIINPHDITNDDKRLVKEGKRFDIFIYQRRLKTGKPCLWVQSTNGIATNKPVNDAYISHSFRKLGKACGYKGSAKKFFGFTCFRKLFIYNVIIGTTLRCQEMRQHFLDCHCMNKSTIRLSNYIDPNRQRLATPGAMVNFGLPNEIATAILQHDTTPAAFEDKTFFTKGENTLDTVLYRNVEEVFERHSDKEKSYSVPLRKLGCEMKCPYKTCTFVCGQSTTDQSTFQDYRNHIRDCKAMRIEKKLPSSYSCACGKYESTNHDPFWSENRKHKNMYNHVMYQCHITRSLFQHYSNRENSNVPRRHREAKPTHLHPVRKDTSELDRILEKLERTLGPFNDPPFGSRIEYIEVMQRNRDRYEKHQHAYWSGRQVSCLTDNPSRFENDDNLTAEQSSRPTSWAKVISVVGRKTLADKRYRCDFCGMKFSCNSLINNHLKTSTVCPGSVAVSDHTERMNTQFVERVGMVVTHIINQGRNVSSVTYKEQAVREDKTNKNINLGRWFQSMKLNYDRASPALTYKHWQALNYLGIPWASKKPTSIRGTRNITKFISQLELVVQYFLSPDFKGYFPVYEDMTMVYVKDNNGQLTGEQFALYHWLQNVRAGYNKWLNEEYKKDASNPDGENWKQADSEDYNESPPTSSNIRTSRSPNGSQNAFYGFTQTKYDLIVEYHLKWILTFKKHERTVSSCKSEVDAMKASLDRTLGREWRPRPSCTLEVRSNDIKLHVLHKRQTICGSATLEENEEVVGYTPYSQLSSFAPRSETPSNRITLETNMLMRLASPDPDYAEAAMQELRKQFQRIMTMDPSPSKTQTLRELIDLSIENLIIVAMHNHRDKLYILLEAMSCLLVLVQLHDKTRKAILKYNGLQNILQAMDVASESNKAQTIAFKTIHKLLQINENHLARAHKKVFVTELHGVEMIKKATDTFSQDDDLQQQALTLLHDLSNEDSLASEVADRGAQQLALDIRMSNLYSDTTKSKGEALLATLEQAQNKERTETRTSTKLRACDTKRIVDTICKNHTPSIGSHHSTPFWLLLKDTNAGVLMVDKTKHEGDGYWTYSASPNQVSMLLENNHFRNLSLREYPLGRRPNTGRRSIEADDLSRKYLNKFCLVRTLPTEQHQPKPQRETKDAQTKHTGNDASTIEQRQQQRQQQQQRRQQQQHHQRATDRHHDQRQGAPLHEEPQSQSPPNAKRPRTGSSATNSTATERAAVTKNVNSCHSICPIHPQRVNNPHTDPDKNKLTLQSGSFIGEVQRIRSSTASEASVPPTPRRKRRPNALRPPPPRKHSVLRPPVVLATAPPAKRRRRKQQKQTKAYRKPSTESVRKARMTQLKEHFTIQPSDPDGNCLFRSTANGLRRLGCNPPDDMGMFRRELKNYFLNNRLRAKSQYYKNSAWREHQACATALNRLFYGPQGTDVVAVPGEKEDQPPPPKVPTPYEAVGVGVDQWGDPAFDMPLICIKYSVNVKSYLLHESKTLNYLFIPGVRRQPNAPAAAGLQAPDGNDCDCRLEETPGLPATTTTSSSRLQATHKTVYILYSNRNHYDLLVPR